MTDRYGDNSQDELQQIDELLQQARDLDQRAKSFQASVPEDIRDDEIEALAESYQEWFGACLAILPDEYHDTFRAEYLGSWKGRKIRDFLAAPTQLSPFHDPEKSTLIPKWTYPFEDKFHKPLLSQQGVLREYRGRVRSMDGSRSAIESVKKGRVFIGHGQNKIVRYQMKDFIRDRCGLTPVVIEELPNRGMTIIEKIEYYGKDCEYGILLLTKDDVMPDGSIRARQNVVFELGWCYGFFGRSHTAIVMQYGTDVFSNIKGIVYEGFNDDKVQMVFERLRREFEELDMIPRTS